MKELTQERKEQIKELLSAYCRRYPSNNRAAMSLKSVSAATVSAILNGKFESISNDMFENIARQVTMGDADWNIQETGAFKEMIGVMTDAQEFANVTWITANAGYGKSTAAGCYRHDHKNVFVVLCSEDMKKTDFIRDLAKAVGVPTDGYSLQEMFDNTIDKISSLDCPLLIFDEGDKLTDSVFHYFITVYNRLEDRTGIVFLSTSYIETRMNNGIRYNKKGYREILSRIGRKFYTPDPVKAVDVFAICKANGLTDEKAIARVIKDVETCEFDLRRAKRVIHREKRLSEK